MKSPLLLFVIVIFSLSVFSQTESPLPILPNQKIEREIKLEGSDNYSFSLNANEFVRFEIDQKNVDPLLIISDAADKILHRLYYEKMVGKIAISFVAPENGTFRLTVKPSERTWTNGNYRLQMSSPRLANETDSERVKGETLLTGNSFERLANKTKVKPKPLTADQKRERLQTLQDLIKTWQKLNEPLLEQETLHQIGLLTENVQLKQTIFEQLLQSARANQDLSDETWASFQLARLAEKRGEIETARKHFLAALEAAQKSGVKMLEGEVLNQLAIFYQDRAQPEKARDALEKMLVIYRDLKNEIREARTNVSLAQVVNDIDRQADTGKIYESALQLFEKNEAFYEKAFLLRVLGSDAADKNRLDVAEKYFIESIALMEKHGEPKDEAFSLLGLGLLKFRQSQFAEAKQFMEKGLTKIAVDPDGKTEIRLLVGLARVGFAQGKLVEGVEVVKKAAKLADEGKIVREQIEVNFLLNTLYLTIGQNEDALKVALYAKKISDESGNKAFQSVAVNALGMSYRFQGDYPQAIKFFDESIKLAEETNQAKAAANGYQALGSLYLELNNFEKAEKNIRKAVEIFDKSSSDIEKSPANLLLALIYLEQNKFAETKAKATELLELAKKSKIVFLEAQAQQILGTVARNEKNYPEALQRYSEALKLHSQAKNTVGISVALKGLADSLLGAGQFDQAQTVYAQTLSVFRQIGSQTAESLVFGQLMDLAKKKGNPRLAVFYGKQSIGLLQKVRGSIKPLDAELRKNFTAPVEFIYRNLAALLIEEGRISEAQQVLGLLKEEEFYQFTQRSPDAASSAIKNIELTAEETVAEQKYKDLTDKITAIVTRSTQLELERRGQTLSPEKLTELQKLQAESANTMAAFPKYLQELGTAFTQPSAEKNAQIITNQTKFWQQKLADLKDETVLLTTLVTDEKYYVIATTPTAQFARQVKISNTDLNNKINKLRQVLEEPRTKVTASAQELYEILVKPIEADLAQNKTKKILWSLDGALRYVPVAALFDGEKYLVEKYTNAVVTLAQTPSSIGQPIAKWKALGVGVSDEIKGFAPLKYVSAELKNIVRDETIKNPQTEKGLFSGKRLLNQDFTRQNLNNSLKQKFQLVHFATHFVFNPGKDIDSYLLLGDGNRLTLADMRNDESFDLNEVELLALSTCETGIDVKNANGTEIESFGVIAQRRGAKSVIATLWSISDNATPQLMSEFYRNYKNGNGKFSKAEALQQAQITLLKKSKANSNYAHPAYWASFIIVGEWR